MSSILKALQKLERDREARQAKPADIQRGILRQSQRRGAQAPPWKLPLAVGAAAILAALGTYLLVGRGTPPSQQAAAVPASPVAVPAPSAPESASPPLPAAQTAQQLSPQPHDLHADRPALTAPRRAPASPSLNDEDEATRPVEHAQASAPPAPPPAAAAPPQISVSGIGWRDDPASRMAMVNGSPVRVGATVQGARVEEIFPDRVRFSIQGRPFEVAVGSSEAVQQ
jgi:general secretion pathway protein B